MTLCTEVIDLIWPHLLDNAGEVTAVGEISVVENQSRIKFVRVFIKVINPASIEGGCTTFDSVYLIALFEQQLGEVGAILAGNAGDQGFFQTFDLAAAILPLR